VGRGMFLADVVDVVGGDDLEVELPGVLEKLGGDEVLLGNAVIGDLEVEIAGGEDVLEGVDGLLGFLHFSREDVAGDFAGEAGAGTDEAVAMLGEDFLVDPRLVVHALEVGGGDELDEVVVTGLVFGEQEKVGGGFLGAVGLAVLATAGGEIDFAADDRFDPGLAAFLVKFDGAEKIAVVAQGEGGHFEFRRALGEFRDAAGSVEEAVLGVDVKMDKGFRRGHGSNLMPIRGRARRNERMCGNDF